MRYSEINELWSGGSDIPRTPPQPLFKVGDWVMLNRPLPGGNDAGQVLKIRISHSGVIEYVVTHSGFNQLTVDEDGLRKATPEEQSAALGTRRVKKRLRKKRTR